MTTVTDSLFAMKSAKQLWLEHTYGGDLPADIKSWVADGMTWKAMAKIISARCQHPVSHESLRTWYHAEAEQVANATRSSRAKANTPLPLDDADSVAAS